MKREKKKEPIYKEEIFYCKDVNDNLIKKTCTFKSNSFIF